MSEIVVKNSYSGLGLSGWLTLIFVTLKLMGVITWNWWWVLSPIWIGLGIVLGVCVLFFVLACLAALLEAL